MWLHASREYDKYQCQPGSSNALKNLKILEIWDIVDRNEPLFVERFSNNNDFSSALHESGISGVAHDNDEKENDDDDANRNTDEDPDSSICLYSGLTCNI